MGKDLRGKELGIGISQRKDGLYTARYTDRRGKRRQRYFKKLQECRNWIAEAQFQDEHGDVLYGENPTVDAWFEYWIENVKGDNIRYNTIKSYKGLYKINICPAIGRMTLHDIKPLHCQSILTSMADRYSNSTIDRTRLVMYGMFDSAVENDLMVKNPVTKSVKCTSGRKMKETKALTIEEQKRFLEELQGNNCYNQFSLILQTGLRIGELIGLRWSDVDFKNRVIHVERTMQFSPEAKEFIIGDPKTRSGKRDIPLTKEAVEILKNQKEKMKDLKVIPFEFADLVFLQEDGIPIKNTAYDSILRYYCDKFEMDRFSVHALRHTFATRCIEAGMRPKTLQMILGHSQIEITMNIYVHVTDDEKAKEIENIEQKLKLV